jgi:hypothetical protein
MIHMKRPQDISMVCSSEKHCCFLQLTDSKTRNQVFFKKKVFQVKNRICSFTDLMDFAWLME